MQPSRPINLVLTALLAMNSAFRPETIPPNAILGAQGCKAPISVPAAEVSPS